MRNHLSKAKNVYFLIGSIFAISSGSAFANMNPMNGARFGAPSVNNHNSVVNPDDGDLVLDTSDGNFYGYGFNGTTRAWAKFQSSASFTAATVTVLSATTGSNQTYTTPTGVLYLKIRMVGAGGGGGGVSNSTNNGGGGGGAGACSEKIVSSPAASYIGRNESNATLRVKKSSAVGSFKNSMHDSFVA